MLAERSATCALLAAAGAATLALAVSPRERAAVAPVVVSIPPAPIDIDCPHAARVALRIDNPLALFCRETDRGTFAIAQYMTTERWERMALVDGSGALVFPIVDQPTPGNANMIDVSIGGPDKTVGYANGRAMRVTFERDVFALDYSAE